MTVPLLDLKAQFSIIQRDVNEAVLNVLASQHFILGPVVEEFEHRIAAYCHAKHAIGVSSGTDALLMALMAEGIGPGDEVVTTDYSFIATASTIARLGATPVFADIDERTFNIDVAAVAAKLTSRTRAIVVVHLFGQMAAMEPVMALALERDLVVIEDAAQAIGAEQSGRRAGSIGHYGCLSFFPSKNLGGAGDGGMVLSNDDERAERLRMIRAHGGRRKYHHEILGGNFRLDAIQAAVLRVKLNHLNAWTTGRRRNAAIYAELTSERGMTTANESRHRGKLKGLILPNELEGNRHVYNQFVVRCAQRDYVRARLTEHGIGTEVYYPVPFHKQQCLQSVGVSGTFPASEVAAAETLALPIYPELTPSMILEVVDALQAAFH